MDIAAAPAAPADKGVISAGGLEGEPSWPVSRTEMDIRIRLSVHNVSLDDQSTSADDQRETNREQSTRPTGKNLHANIGTGTEHGCACRGRHRHHVQARMMPSCAGDKPTLMMRAVRRCLDAVSAGGDA